MFPIGRLVRLTVLYSCVCIAGPAQTVAQKAFTLQQVMSAPFNSDLVAAPAKDAFAWAANVDGRRNVWVAFPSADPHAYTSRELTDYQSDDGQAIGDLTWSPDAQFIAYVRGGSSDNPERRAPNPAHLPNGAEQDVWIVSANGGAPRKVGAGHAPTFSPAGDLLTWFSDGQIWHQNAADIGTKPSQSIRVFGDCKSFTWSPDGKRLAFVNDRGSHSFIGVFSPVADALIFLDPGSDHDNYPVWSPDSRQVAFIRIPYFKEENFDGPQRSGEPWSIRVADVATGQAREIWKAAPGQGSVFRALDATQQLYWMADGHLIFPWEADGWLHLYAIPIAGGRAHLLTPGKFEVENATGTPDRKEVVYSSNQDDSERRHIWHVSASREPVALSRGDGIETQPAVGSDSRTIAVLRSDVRIPMRPAVLAAPGQIRDLAPRMIPADFPAAQMVAPRPVVYAATDGLHIHGGLFLPPGGGACVRHPAVVFVHGGSQRQMLLGWHFMDYYSNAYALNQYLASRGYVVLSINYRSGIGYGLDFREALQYGPTGTSEFRDVEGAGQYLRSRCDVQPNHIGIWGGSWGGFLTALALARDSKLFAAGVDMSGVHDWNIDNPQNFQISDTAADINARWRLAWQSSPLASVDMWRSPVLLVQGDNDDEVPFLQTVQLAAALRQRNVAVQELIFPDEVHAFLLHRNWLAAYAATAAFFDDRFHPQQASPAR